MLVLPMDFYYYSIQTLENPRGKEATNFENRTLNVMKESAKKLNLNYSN